MHSCHDCLLSVRFRSWRRLVQGMYYTYVLGMVQYRYSPPGISRFTGYGYNTCQPQQHTNRQPQARLKGHKPPQTGSTARIRHPLAPAMSFPPPPPPTHTQHAPDIMHTQACERPARATPHTPIPRGGSYADPHTRAPDIVHTQACERPARPTPHTPIPRGGSYADPHTRAPDIVHTQACGRPARPTPHSPIPRGGSLCRLTHTCT